MFNKFSELHLATYVPTPEMLMTIPFDDDPEVNWEMKFMNGNREKIIVEFTPEEQTIEAWKEMLAQEITFTKKSLGKYLSIWKRAIRSGDPNVVVKDEKKEKNLYICTYRSELFNEFSIRIFIKASDGIYAQAYHIRLDQPNEERIELWRSLIPKSSLMPSPHRN